MTAPKDSGYPIPVEHLDQAIVEIRGKRVILSHDLAEAYGVTTKRLNEQVKRNIEWFPDDFMFQLTPDEKAEVVANCDHLAILKFSPSLPYAFTEHGAVVPASAPLRICNLQSAMPLAPPTPPRRKIGFATSPDDNIIAHDRPPTKPARPKIRRRQASGRRRSPNPQT